LRKYNKHLIVVGSARSGTSWLAETIAAQHRYRLLFEPEHEHNTAQGKLLCDKYITPENATAEIHKYLNQVFLNRIDNDWIGQASNRKYKRHLWPIIPKKYIIKFVRANLSARYMNEEFKIPLIHIIRNPYEVLHSQQRVKFPWLYDLSHFQRQEELLEMVLKNYKIDLSSVKKFSELEILAVRWCLENVFPLQLKKEYTYQSMIVRHEELRNDIQLFYKIAETFKLEPVIDLEKRYTVPSSKTHPRSEVRSGQSLERKFTGAESKLVNDILDQFECELYPRKY